MGFKKGEYSGILQIMGLASAMGCSIKMIFPDNRHKLFALLNGRYHPRIQPRLCPEITIMWTNTGGWQPRSHSFLANHFVVMLPVTKSNRNTWQTVENKKRKSQFNSPNLNKYFKKQFSRNTPQHAFAPQSSVTPTPPPSSHVTGPQKKATSKSSASITNSACFLFHTPVVSQHIITFIHIYKGVPLFSSIS